MAETFVMMYLSGTSHHSSINDHLGATYPTHHHHTLPISTLQPTSTRLSNSLPEHTKRNKTQARTGAAPRRHPHAFSPSPYSHASSTDTQRPLHTHLISCMHLSEDAHCRYDSPHTFSSEKHGRPNYTSHYQTYRPLLLS